MIHIYVVIRDVFEDLKLPDEMFKFEYAINEIESDWRPTDHDAEN